MAKAMVRLSIILLLLLMAIVAEGDPGPKQVKCQNKSFPDCYHVKLLCPDDCLRACVVDSASCQPICAISSPPPTPMPSASLPPPTESTLPPTPFSPPPPTESTPPATPFSPPPPTLSPPTASTPPPTPSPFSHPAPLPPLAPSPTEAPPSPSLSPKAPPPTPSGKSPPSPASLPPHPPTSSTSPKKAQCKSRRFPHCYRMKFTCLSACPDSCEIDCNMCRPVCNCNQPGAVCQDPRFVGGDGLTFYFHGKKDKDFCLVSDANLHINAHFIGRRNPNMRRDFTWVQSLGILFSSHRLFIGARKTATWDDSVDRLALAFDGEPIALPDGEGASWLSNPKSPPLVSITRFHNVNAVEIEVEGSFRIRAKAVPITCQDSDIHSYGVTDEDCFAHLDLGFKFYALSEEVTGVLGQTYASGYVSKVKIGVPMPILGGERGFASSNLFATDCAVARFSAFDNEDSSSLVNIEHAKLNYTSGMGGRGVVCRR